MTKTMMMINGVPRNFVRANFKIEGTGTKEGAENKNRAAKSIDILMCSKFLRSSL